MRPLILILLLACSSSVLGKNGVKTLTESLGQEVIEIGTPIKELPADMEEEPSIENEEDEHLTTSTSATTTTRLTTKKETRKPSVVASTIRPKKPSINSDDEEDRIEKELAEIYKDTVDYKDIDDTTFKTTTKTTNSTVDPSKPIGLRSNDKDNFKFQPDPFNKAEIERFRTSVDDISCGKKLKAKDNLPDSSHRIVINILVVTFCLFTTLLV